MMEAGKGYPLHLWYAVGHLAEAEDECLRSYPELAEGVRRLRLGIMGQREGGYNAQGHRNALEYAVNLLAGSASKEEQRIKDLIKSS